MHTIINYLYLMVAPYVGAWIETIVKNWSINKLHVAPYVGAWIETKDDTCHFSFGRRRTLRGCVD